MHNTRDSSPSGTAATKLRSSQHQPRTVKQHIWNNSRLPLKPPVARIPKNTFRARSGQAVGCDRRELLSDGAAEAETLCHLPSAGMTFLNTIATMGGASEGSWCCLAVRTSMLTDAREACQAWFRCACTLPNLASTSTKKQTKQNHTHAMDMY